MRCAVQQLLSVPLPARRQRALPRAVKRKMSHYHLKRAAHHAWPQPTMPPANAIAVLPALPATSCRSP
jgi:hypothetical protein